MKKIMGKLSVVFLLSMLLVFPALALADGPYITGLGGYTFVPDLDGEFGGQDIGQASMSDGWKAGGSLGYDFGSIRIEAESFYGENDIDSISSALIPTLTGNGEASIFAAMGNIFYDFEMEGSGLTPYLGGGVGWAEVHIQGAGNVTVPSKKGPAVLSGSSHTHDNGLAYQLIGGVGYSITENLSGFADYRYFRMDKVDLPLGIKTDLSSHSVNVGVRYNF